MGGISAIVGKVPDSKASDIGGLFQLGTPCTSDSAGGLVLPFRPTRRSTDVPFFAALNSSFVSVTYGAASYSRVELCIILVNGLNTKSLEGPFEKIRFMLCL